MNVILINLDFVTEDALRSLAGLLRLNDLVVCTYHEKETDHAPSGNSRTIVEQILEERGDRPASIISIAPGFSTLKYLHDVARSDLQKGAPRTHIAISLPEHWIIKKMEILDVFEFESFYTCLSSCLSMGYPLMSITCVEKPCAGYYSTKMLGGFMPDTVSIQGLFENHGIVKHLPIGLG